uniref:Putative secreted protein n=1 Tax=Amblyomma americanum TaxID=6943 RepID=A0A0C9SD21_AMBAM
MLVTFVLAAAFAISVGAQEFPPEEPHYPSNTDCNPSNDTAYIYKQCEFRCSDEMTSLDGKQACYLQSQESQTPELPPVDRSEPEALIGECVNGKCTKKNSAPVEPVS